MSIFKFGNIFGHTGCVKWPKGPKMAILKNSLSVPGQIGNIGVKNCQYVFRQSGQIRVSYHLDIGNFFLHKKFLRSKNQIWENRFLGLKFFPDFGAQICQQHIFIIWRDGQTPHQSFFTIVSPNGPTGKSLYPIFVLFGPMTHYSQTPDQNCHRGPKDGK